MEHSPRNFFKHKGKGIKNAENRPKFLTADVCLSRGYGELRPVEGS